MTIQQIIDAVSAYYGISIGEMESLCRDADIVKARHMVFYFSRKYTNHNLSFIGKQLCRQHAAVLHACKSILNQSSTSASFNDEVIDIDGIIASIDKNEGMPLRKRVYNPGRDMFMENDYFTPYAHIQPEKHLYNYTR